jgi:hypothetical protein
MNNKPISVTPIQPNPPRSGRRLAWVACVALVCGLLVGGLLAVGSRTSASVVIALCADRQIEVGLSSPERTPLLQRFAVQVIAEAAVSAAVCNRAAEAFAVGGGGAVFSLLSTDDVARFTPKGPNRAVRVGRLDPTVSRTIEALVADRLHRAYLADRTPAVSSIAALYEVAAEHAGPTTDVVMVTAGVNHDGQVDLNRPLETGDGARLAAVVSIPRVADHVTTVVGIAQVDAAIPVPGPSWPAEIRSFNERVCRASGAGDCRLFSVASVIEALTP